MKELEKAVEELKSRELKSKDNNGYLGLVTLSDAIQILNNLYLNLTKKETRNY